jgi:hypothetical protein
MTNPLVRRCATVALLSLGVVLLHWAAFVALAERARQSGPSAAVPVRVRTVLVDAPPAAWVAPMSGDMPSPGAPQARRRPVQARKAPKRPPVQPLHDPVQVSQAQVASVAEVASSAPAAEPTDATAEVPVYPTRIPPPVRWTYTITRAGLTGEGEFRWHVDGTNYEARLDGRVAGVSVLDWTSRGGFDAAGVAPERFVVRRRGRDAQAANFQRAAGKITFSGPATEFPLVAGAQDRLSWMVQLPAILAATPERFAVVGARIVLFVAGARGDAATWTFTVAGSEPVTLPDGSTVQAIQLLRQPRKPYDVSVQVWLDPGRHYLPVRARMANEGREADALELLRSGEVPGS